MNYKKKMDKFLKEAKAGVKESYQEGELNGQSIQEAYKALELTRKILEERFRRELKQYNNDEKRATDEFVARKNLEYLGIFIEEFLLLDREEKEISYTQVQKRMRHLLNAMYVELF